MADDAETEPDEQIPPKTQPQTPDVKPSPVQDNTPKSLEQEVKELREEVQRIRNENEARKKLEVPEEEKSKSVEDILSAAGRQYTLLKKGTIGLEYQLDYSYYSGDVFPILRRSNAGPTTTLPTPLLGNMPFGTI